MQYIILNLWNELVLFFENKFTLFDLTLQAAFLGFLNVDSELLLIQNHLLLIFKIYIYNSRKSESLKIKSLIREITKVKNIEEKISLNNEKKHAIYKRKWQLVENVSKTKTFDILSDSVFKSRGIKVKTESRQKGLVFINLRDR